MTGSKIDDEKTQFKKEYEKTFTVQYVKDENTPLVKPSTRKEYDRYDIFTAKISDGRWLAWSEYLEIKKRNDNIENIRTVSTNRDAAVGALVTYIQEERSKNF